MANLPSTPFATPQQPTLPNKQSSGKVQAATEPGDGFSLPPGALTGAAAGVGSVLSGMGAQGQEQERQKQSAYGDIASMYDRFNTQNQNVAQSTLPYTGPEKTVAPYAKMALQNALLQGYGKSGGPQAIQAANPMVSRYQPQMPQAADWQGLAKAGDQYMGDNALMNAQFQQQANLAQANPAGTPWDMTANFGSTQPDKALAMNNALGGQRTDIANQTNTNRVNEASALNSALQASLKKPSLGSQILGGITAAAPYLLGGK